MSTAPAEPRTMTPEEALRAERTRGMNLSIALELEKYRPEPQQVGGVSPFSIEGAQIAEYEPLVPDQPRALTPQQAAEAQSKAVGALNIYSSIAAKARDQALSEGAMEFSVNQAGVRTDLEAIKSIAGPEGEAAYHKAYDYYRLARVAAESEMNAVKYEDTIREIPKRDRRLFEAILGDVVNETKPKDEASRGFWAEFGDRVIGGVAQAGRSLDALQNEVATGAGEGYEESAFAGGAYAIGRARRDKIAQERFNTFERGALSVGEMAPLVAGTAAAEALAGTPGAIAFWSAQTTPGYYRDLRQSGFTHEQALVGGAASGLADASIEMIVSPLRALGVKGGISPEKLTGYKRAAWETVKHGVIVNAGELSEEYAQPIAAAIIKEVLDQANDDTDVDLYKEIQANLPKFPETAIAIGIMTTPGIGIQAMSNGLITAENKKFAKDKEQARQMRETAMRVAAAVAVMEDPEGSRAIAEKESPSRKDVPGLDSKSDREMYSQALRDELARQETENAQQDTQDGEVHANVRVERGPQEGPQQVPQQEGSAGVREGGQQEGAAEVKEPWQMTRREWYTDTRTQGPLQLAREERDAAVAKEEELSKRLYAGEEIADEYKAALLSQEQADAKVERLEKRLAKGDLSVLGPKPDEPGKQHRQSVEQAVEQNKPVPQEVLAEYPDLAEKVKVQGRSATEGQRPATQAFAGEAPAVPVEATESARPMSNWEIVRGAERIFGVPIDVGRMMSRQKSAKGEYHTHYRAVRMLNKAGGDLAVATHEVAHHIDQKNKVTTEDGPKNMPPAARAELQSLDYDSKKARESEGFAEFMRHYWTEGDNAARAVAPSFHDWFVNKWMVDNPEYAQKIAQMSGYMEQYRRQGLVERARANLNLTGKPAGIPKGARAGMFGEMLNRAMHYVYAANIDEGHYLNLFVKDAKKRGMKVEPGSSPYELFLALGQDGPNLAANAIENGVFAMSDPRKKLGPSLSEVFDELAPDEIDNFKLWAWAEHAREAWRFGQNPGMTLEEANAVYEAFESDKFHRAADKFREFNNGLVRVLADVGRISADEMNAILSKYELYVPLLRVKPKYAKMLGAASRQKLGDAGTPLKRRSAEGSGYQVLDPVVSAIERAIRIYTTAATHLVTERVIQTAEAVPELGRGGEHRWAVPEPPGVTPTKFKASEILDQLIESEVISSGETADYQDALHAPARFKDGQISETRLDSLAERFGVDLDGLEDADGLPIEVTPKELAKLVKQATESVLDAQMAIFRPDFRPRGDEPVVKVYRNGKPQLWRLDPNLYRFAVGMDQFTMGRFVENTFGAGTRLLKLGATRMNPTFAARNLTRDMLTFLVQGRKFEGMEKVSLPVWAMRSWVYSAIQEARGQKGDPIVQLFKEMGGELSPLLGLDRNKKRVLRKAREITQVSSRYGKAARAANPVEWIEFAVNTTEITPRLAQFAATLERRGYSRERVGKGDLPPLNVLVEAINDAHDVTVNFKRMGFFGKKVNRFIPFWNASLQGLDKFGRVWLDDPVGAIAWGGALAAATAAYWLQRKDDDDYRDMPEWLKYGFWTITDDDGKPIARLPRPFEWGWLVSAGTEAMLNAVNERDPQVIADWATAAVHNTSPGFQVSLVTPTMEAAFNYSFFREGPIVSQADVDRLEPRDQYRRYNTELMKAIGDYLNVSPAKLEYAVNQYTGGMYRNVAAPIERALAGKPIREGDAPVIGGFELRRDYQKVIQDFYDRREELNKKIGSGKLHNRDVSKEKREHDTLETVANFASDARKLYQDIETRDARFKYEKYVIGAMRAATGLNEVGRYPNPFATDNLPPDLKVVRDDILLTRARALARGAPDDPVKRKEWLADIHGEMETAKALNVQPQFLYRAYYRDAMRDASKRTGRRISEAERESLIRLKRQLAKLQPAKQEGT